jgi:hypothetical protein
MKPPSSPRHPREANKLIIRSEVLGVIRHLATLASVSSTDKARQVQRLHAFQARHTVQEILLKELQRNQTGQSIRMIGELLCEFALLQEVRESLWHVIVTPHFTDLVKDTAHLVLRHLGDDTDPSLYLQYLADPEGFVGEETVRMLELSVDNPEALIDFIDFIYALPPQDQTHLLEALYRDYPLDYLVKLFIPLLASQPNEQVSEHVIEYLAQSKSAYALKALEEWYQWPAEKMLASPKVLKKAINQIQLALGSVYPADLPHGLFLQTQAYEAYLTLPDGMGNQGVLMGRLRADGDLTIMSAALNDEYGLIDCFGFFQISPSDFHKIADKFHEGATKFRVPDSLALSRLLQAARQNNAQYNRLPYEYLCWIAAFCADPENPPEADEGLVSPDWVHRTWNRETHNLFQHPDMSTWFLEPGDRPEITPYLESVSSELAAFLAEQITDVGFLEHLNDLVAAIASVLMETSWAHYAQGRLAHAASLFHLQGTVTFRDLAATESARLKDFLSSSSDVPYTSGFLTRYSRRCVAETLLRLRTNSPHYASMTPLIHLCFEQWELV